MARRVAPTESLPIPVPYPEPSPVWSASRPDRRVLIACTRCPSTDPTGCDPLRPGWHHVGRRWQIPSTHPGAAWAAPGRPGAVIEFDGTCMPTIESIERSPVPGDWEGEWSYRGACLGCGWAGPERADDHDAICDAHDHTHPGWRELPVVARCPSPEGAKDRSRVKWDAEIAQIYEAAGIPEIRRPNGYLGGPIRTERNPNGTNSYFNPSFNGYDIWSGTCPPGAVWPWYKRDQAPPGATIGPEPRPMAERGVVADPEPVTPEAGQLSMFG